MSESERKKDMITAAAYALAQRHVAMAASRFGPKPEQPTVEATPEVSPKLYAHALALMAAQKATKAAETATPKSVWARAVARINGQPKPKADGGDNHGWGAVVAKHNAKKSGEPDGERKGWAKAIANVNSGRGRV